MRFTGRDRAVNLSAGSGLHIKGIGPGHLVMAYHFKEENEYTFYVFMRDKAAYIGFDQCYEPSEVPFDRFLTAVIKDFHPEKILCKDPTKEERKVLAKKLFYARGKDMQRIVEPWRYCISDKVFDPEGYIINQGMMEALPFGLFNTKDKGCGWIAAYNLLKINGQEVTMEEVAKALDKHAPLGHLFGEWVYSLYFYLKQKLPVRMMHFSKALCVQAMKRSTSGIFLYVHKRGSHYVAYRRVGENRFHFYNAVYGHAGLQMSAEEFMKQFTFLPVANLIWIE